MIYTMDYANPGMHILPVLSRYCLFKRKTYRTPDARFISKSLFSVFRVKSVKIPDQKGSWTESRAKFSYRFNTPTLVGNCNLKVHQWGSCRKTNQRHIFPNTKDVRLACEILIGARDVWIIKFFKSESITKMKIMRNVNKVPSDCHQSIS